MVNQISPGTPNIIRYTYKVFRCITVFIWCLVHGVHSLPPEISDQVLVCLYWELGHCPLHRWWSCGSVRCASPLLMRPRMVLSSAYIVIKLLSWVWAQPCVYKETSFGLKQQLCVLPVFLSVQWRPILTVCLGESSGSSYRWVLVLPGLPALQLFLGLMMLKAECWSGNRGHAEVFFKSTCWRMKWRAHPLHESSVKNSLNSLFWRLYVTSTKKTAITSWSFNFNKEQWQGRIFIYLLLNVPRLVKCSHCDVNVSERYLFSSWSSSRWVGIPMRPSGLSI